MLPCEESEYMCMSETAVQYKRGFGIMRWFGLFFSNCFSLIVLGGSLLHHHSEQCLACYESWGGGEAGAVV